MEVIYLCTGISLYTLLRKVRALRGKKVSVISEAFVLFDLLQIF